MVWCEQRHEMCLPSWVSAIAMIIYLGELLLF